MNAPANASKRLYVISGCSGSGKSTLLQALADAGEAVVEEPGRVIVREELASGGEGVPWIDLQRFVDLCSQRAIRDYDRCASLPQRTFFDRSFIEFSAAVNRLGLVAPAALEEALRTRRYSPLVFMSPPWEALFTTDEERRHTFEEAVAEYDTLVPEYRAHGYELVFLPLATVSERVEFVLATIAAFESKGAP